MEETKPCWMVIETNNGDRIRAVFDGDLHGKRRAEAYATRVDGCEVKVVPFRLGPAIVGLRAQVFKRDGDRCVKCTKTVTWNTGHLHEKVSRGQLGERSLENCETLCADCHIGSKGAHGFATTRKRLGVPEEGQETNGGGTTE